MPQGVIIELKYCEKNGRYVINRGNRGNENMAGVAFVPSVTAFFQTY